MIDSNTPAFLNDLQEVVNLFYCGQEFNIIHRFKKSENKFVNTITVDGQTFAYGNFISKIENELEEKRLTKRYAKLSLYKALEKKTGLSLPWGALTGIRPTKLAYDVMEKEGDFKSFFTDVMKVSEEKTLLTEMVINSQKNIYKKSDDSTDFFVFIPFCPSRCKYCSFICTDVKSSEKYVDQYVDALIHEIEYSKRFVKNLRSIYIGGGTPVSLSNKNLERILKAISSINTGVEFTVEAGRPDVITKENLALLSDYGVNRICINPQTFCDDTLIRLNRNHTASDVIEKFNMAKGRFSINMDFIAGLEGEDFGVFKNSINTAISLKPDNITVHTLCVKRGSNLATEKRFLDKGQVEFMVDYARNSLINNGYNPYYLYRQKYMAANLENVGYSIKGKECVYNIDTMEEISSTVACGANAISKRVTNSKNLVERYASPKDVLTYLTKIDKIFEGKALLFE